MKSIRFRPIPGIALLLLASTITFSLISNVIGQEVPPAIEVGSDGVLFAIGVVDEDVTEFQQFDWEVPDWLVIPGGKMPYAMELILTQNILDLLAMRGQLERRRNGEVGDRAIAGL